MDHQLAENGVDAAVSEYEKLREEYYGSHSYDFSEFVLPMYTQGLAATDQADAAIAIAEVNAKYFPESYYTAFVLGDLYAATVEKYSAPSCRAIFVLPKRRASVCRLCCTTVLHEVLSRTSRWPARCCGVKTSVWLKPFRRARHCTQTGINAKLLDEA